jgi:hypothetical protein
MEIPGARKKALITVMERSASIIFPTREKWFSHPKGEDYLLTSAF